MRQLVVRISATLLLTGGLTVVTSQAAQAAEQFCDEGRAAPCLVSILRDGDPVDPLVHSGFVDTYTPPDDDHNTGFTLLKNGSDDLAGEVGHVFSVTLDTGSIQPRIVSGWGIDGHAVRIDDGDGTWQVEITLEPAEMLMSCIGEACPVTAPDSALRVRAGVHVDDASW